MMLTTQSKVAVVCGAVFSLSLIFLIRWRQKRELRRRQRKKNQGSLNIGGIFGCDFGGTLSKIVYFETKTGNNHNAKKDHDDTVEIPGRQSLRRNISLGQLDTPDHQVALDELYSYMDSSRDTSGVSTRDDSLSFYSNILGGRLHFLHFETRNMVSGIEMLSATGITENIRTIGCTGGGAHKYAKEFEEQLGITFVQLDELGCLVRGMNFALTNVVGECYTYRNDATDPIIPSKATTPNISPRRPGDPAKSPGDEEHSKHKEHSKDSKEHSKEHSKDFRDSRNDTPSTPKEENTKDEGWRRDVKEHTYKVTMPYEMFVTNELFPYLVVNIGSGVSILKVKSPGVFERVSGSSLGGGTYWGLCRLLTRCATYEDVLDIAETGDAGEVDMLVRDIYGGGYDGMNLSGSMVASSFGKLVMKEHPRDGVKEEDLAIALLMMITNNIGQVSYLNALLHGCTKIFFVGSFLRHNPISCRRLAYAIDFWSKGKMEALFLTHEGYFGALGTFLQSAFGKDVDKILCLNRPDGGRDQEGTALPYVARTTKQTIIKGNLSDSIGSSRSNSSNSIFNQDNSSQRNNDNLDNNVRTNRKDNTGVYGLDNEFLKQICSWRPKAFSNTKINEYGQEINQNDLRNENNSRKSPVVAVIPTFEQFRKATETLWERAQDLLPMPKKEGKKVEKISGRSVDRGGERGPDRTPQEEKKRDGKDKRDGREGRQGSLGGGGGGEKGGLEGRGGIEGRGGGGSEGRGRSDNRSPLMQRQFTAEELSTPDRFRGEDLGSDTRPRDLGSDSRSDSAYTGEVYGSEKRRESMGESGNGGNGGNGLGGGLGGNGVGGNSVGGNGNGGNGERGDKPRGSSVTERSTTRRGRGKSNPIAPVLFVVAPSATPPLSLDPSNSTVDADSTVSTPRGGGMRQIMISSDDCIVNNNILIGHNGAHNSQRESIILNNARQRTSRGEDTDNSRLEREKELKEDAKEIIKSLENTIKSDLKSEVKYDDEVVVAVAVATEIPREKKVEEKIENIVEKIVKTDIPVVVGKVGDVGEIGDVVVTTKSSADSDFHTLPTLLSKYPSYKEYESPPYSPRKPVATVEKVGTETSISKSQTETVQNVQNIQSNRNVLNSENSNIEIEIVSNKNNSQNYKTEIDQSEPTKKEHSEEHFSRIEPSSELRGVSGLSGGEIDTTNDGIKQNEKINENESVKINENEKAVSDEKSVTPSPKKKIKREKPSSQKKNTAASTTSS